MLQLLAIKDIICKHIITKIRIKILIIINTFFHIIYFLTFKHNIKINFFNLTFLIKEYITARLPLQPAAGETLCREFIYFV